jgi:hypothetical protein
MNILSALLSNKRALAVAALLVAAGSSACSRADSDLSRAYQTIAGKKFVDLTQAFGPETPVWAGFGQAKFSATVDPKTHQPYTIAKDGSRHGGRDGGHAARVDPPAHLRRAASRRTRSRSSRCFCRSSSRRHAVSHARTEPRVFGRRSDRLGREHGRVPPSRSSRCTACQDWDTNPERFKRSLPGWR